LTVVIDRMLEDPEFGKRIDTGRIGAAGFSLGGYTMIEIAGGITNPSGYKDFCASPAADGICKSPPEFPDLAERFSKFDELAKTDPEIGDSVRHAGDSYRDRRVRAVFAMAPALGPAFTQESLRKIAVPVEIVAGQSDQNVPIKSSAQYFGAQIPRSKVTILPGGVGHYVFLANCTAAGRKARPELCTDASDVDREAIHQQAVAMAAAFFDRTLK
jgi:predicted dienelactone hydrolase